MFKLHVALEFRVCIPRKKLTRG